MDPKVFDQHLSLMLEEVHADLMIKSHIGNDLVFLPDFEKSLNPLFIKKVYTASEIAYCEGFVDKVLHYASTWAAKEAVYKVIKQVYPVAVGFKKIEVLREKTGGIPRVNLGEHPAVSNKISLSISHDGDYVWAIAVLSKES